MDNNAKWFKILAPSFSVKLMNLGYNTEDIIWSEMTKRFALEIDKDIESLIKYLPKFSNSKLKLENVVKRDSAFLQIDSPSNKIINPKDVSETSTSLSAAYLFASVVTFEIFIMFS